jgi:GR25 family glycosyltransferase involved in LPS biosynthesis
MVTWNNQYICEAGFVINLNSRIDRYERSKESLISCNFLGVERFDAVVINDPNFTKYGCTQSHIEIAKLQVENNWKYVLYLEDDIVPDIFYSYEIDNNKINKSKVFDNIIKDFFLFNPDVLWLGVRPEGETKFISNTLVEPTKTLMSHAYIGSIKYAEFLLDNLKYKDMSHFSGGWPIDFFISQITTKDDWRLSAYDTKNIFKQNDLKIMVTTPMIFNQGESHSNLTDNFVDYKTWVQGSYNYWINPNKLNINPILNE